MVAPHKVNQLETRIAELESLLAQSRKEADTLRNKCASEAEKQQTATEEFRKRQQLLESENSSLRKQLTQAAMKAQELTIIKSRYERMMNELTALREGKSMAENAAIAAAGLQERFATIARERDMLQDRVTVIEKERDLMQEKLRTALTRERELLEDIPRLSQQNIRLRREPRTAHVTMDGTLDMPLRQSFAESTTSWQETGSPRRVMKVNVHPIREAPFSYFTKTRHAHCIRFHPHHFHQIVYAKACHLQRDRSP